MPTKAGNVVDGFKSGGGSKQVNMLFGQPWWRSLSNNGISATSTSNDSTTRTSSGEPVNGSALAGCFSVHIHGMQDTGASACRQIQTALAPQSGMHLFLFML